ncbi:MAG TPA: hypothetical protein VIU85_04815 [Chthoniobacterales bacterium]
MFGVHRDLRCYVSVALYVSAGLGIFGIVFLILGLTRGDAYIHPPDWPFVIFGLVAIASGILGTTLVPRYYRIATRVVTTVEPIAQFITLELVSDADSTSLYAMRIDPKKKHPTRFGLILPIWNVESLLNQSLPVSAYINPATHRPVAFRTAKGMLWCMHSWQGQA